MSINYYVYLGAYIEIVDNETPIRKTSSICSKCGAVYVNGEKFCSQDGNPIEDSVKVENVKINSWWNIVELYEGMGIHGFESYDDEFYSPENISVMLSNNEGTNDTVSSTEIKAFGENVRLGSDLL